MCADVFVSYLSICIAPLFLALIHSNPHRRPFFSLHRNSYMNGFSFASHFAPMLIILTCKHALLGYSSCLSFSTFPLFSTSIFFLFEILSHFRFLFFLLSRLFLFTYLRFLPFSVQTTVAEEKLSVSLILCSLWNFDRTKVLCKYETILSKWLASLVLLVYVFMFLYSPFRTCDFN